MNLTSEEFLLILSLLENNRNMDDFVSEEIYDSCIDKMLDYESKYLI